jgi:uncharacterized protein (DUF1330 family)
MARGCARSPDIGKPLRVAVEGTPDTTEAKKNSLAPPSGQCGQVLNPCYRVFLDLPQALLTEVHFMPAYFIVQNTIEDEAQYQKYVQAVVPFIASFGGKLVARRAKVEVLEGEHDQRPVVMFEFPDMDAIHAFWNSPDYIPIKKLREGIATMNIWAFPDA